MTGYPWDRSVIRGHQSFFVFYPVRFQQRQVLYLPDDEPAGGDAPQCVVRPLQKLHQIGLGSQAQIG
jgi:hypothetical protein